MFEKKSHNAPEEQRLVPRFPLPKEQAKFFFDDFADLEESSGLKGKIFAIRDISANGIGIGLLEVGEALLFPVGTFCRAELKLGNTLVSVRLKVARINAWSIGFVFVDIEQTSKDLIQRFIHPLRVAKSMKSVSVHDLTSTFATGVSTWYHGESATDLYFWRDARGGVNRVLLSMGKNFWEWSDQAVGPNRVRTGTMDFLEDDRAEFHYHPHLSAEIVETAWKILEHIEGMDYRLVNFLKDQAAGESNG